MYYRADYDTDETRQASYRYWLEVIGEAARHVSPELRQAQPDMAWMALTGMRNRIVHVYLGIDDDIVWRTADERIPELIQKLRDIIDGLPGEAQD